MILLDETLPRPKLDNLLFLFGAGRNSSRDVDLGGVISLDDFLEHNGQRVCVSQKEYVLSISDPRDTLVLTVSRYSPKNHYYGEIHFPLILGHSTSSSNSFLKVLNRVILTRPLEEADFIRGFEDYPRDLIREPTIRFVDYDGLVSRTEEINQKYFPGFKLKHINQS